MPPQISFSQVPANALAPFVYVEFDSSRAGATGLAFRSLMIGQRLAAGTQPAERPRVVGNAIDAEVAFGRGSMLAIQCAAFRRSAPLAELWAVALDDATGSTQGLTTVTVTAAATAAGTISLYVAGRLVRVPIASGATISQVAAAIVAAVNADTGLPVTAAAVAAVATLTARNAGLAASDIDVRVNYQPDESLPTGVALTIAAGTPGAGDPDVQDALDAVADEQFNLIASAYSDATSVATLEADLATRWGPASAIDGQGIVAYRGAGGTVAQATTFGNARNSLHSTVVGAGRSPTPTWEIAAAATGAVAPAAQADPARPFQTLQLIGVVAPEVQDRWTFSERNVLLADGISTYRVDAGGNVRIERMITTSQTNFAGVPDAAYLDLNTPLTLSYLRADFRNYILGKYARHKLADDGVRLAPGQPIITPNLGRAEAVSRFRRWEELGLVENAEQFKEELVVVRNASDRNRLDWLLPTDLVNQFRIGGVQIAFIL